MTPKEAIRRIKEHNEIHSQKERNAIFITEALNIAIEALEKLIPKSKRAPFDTESISCGNCNSDISDTDYTHCPYCGQKLDWKCLSDSETTFECGGRSYIILFDDEEG